MTNTAQFQIWNAIACGHIALQVERDKRDWLKQAIEKACKELGR